ncbi:hypothetical protein SAMN05421579_10453 [Xenorhabdus japonica]|uniref:Uncharacterized protein n=1 Tax=Xenorhabdus japonica TaxID=53341 RepID=A0A1I4Z543_9GAMM|nr:hypothetical protein SAMN05421579_10453 [Xenorhabdus japonica]
MLAGFDIQRHPFQIRPIGGIGFHLITYVGFVAEPNGSSSKALHHKPIGWADICFVEENTLLPERFFQMLQLTIL